MLKDNTKFKNFLLLLSVFITGTSVLVIEIIAIRILSPHYGNTIYTTSSVLGIVLTALSLGYYLGGKISDKYPRYGFFYGIILIAGVLTVLIHILNVVLLPFLSLLLSISYGPLVSSIVLFFIPSFFLGMLSPFAIKLYEKSSELHNELGSHSGKVLFWGTMGSITGSFLSGFVLIPRFGINSIVIGTGIILILWGFFWVLFFDPKKKTALTFIAIIAIFLILISFYLSGKSNIYIYEKDGIYEKIMIRDVEWHGRQTRFLYQDRSWSSAMYLDSDELVFGYTKYYELYNLFNSDPKNIIVMGGGAYSIPKAILKNSPNTNVDVSEIEPEYINIAKKYFNLEDSDRLNNFTEDGRRLLMRSQTKYDAIISDVYYSIFSIPIHFTTREFFELAKGKLSDNGVFIGNFVGNLEDKKPSFILSEIKTFKEVFDNSYFFAVESPESNSGQNIIFLGINGNKGIDFNSNEVKNNKSEIISSLGQKNINIDNFNLSLHNEITDDFAPVEYMVSTDIKKFY